MGRTGGGGGGHVGGGHGSHHISSHIGRGNSHSSSGRLGGSSGFGSSRSYSRTMGPSRPMGPSIQSRPSRPSSSPRPVGHRYSNPSGRHATGGSSCFGTVATLIVVMVVIFALLKFSGIGGGSDYLAALPEYANKQYESVFEDREDGLLVVITEDDLGQAVYGNDAARIMDKYIESMWKEYDNNYDDDLGLQLGNMFSKLARTANNNNVEPIKSKKGFDTKCFVDNLNWVDSKSYLAEGAEEFYDATGIQPYVMLVTNKAVKKETGMLSGILKIFGGVAKVFLICISVIIIVVILFVWWNKRVKQKNKEQEDLERTLNIPLDTFGSPINDLQKKYDNMSSGSEMESQMDSETESTN